MRGKRVKEDNGNKEKIIIFVIIVVVIIMGIVVFKPHKKAEDNTINNNLTNESQVSVSNYNNNTESISTRTEEQNDQILTIDNKDIWEGKRYNVGTLLELKDKKNANRFSKAVVIKCDENYDIIETEEPIDITLKLKDKGYTFNETGIYLIQLFDENNNQIKTNETNLRFIIK